MNKGDNRSKYLADLPKFIKLIKLTPELCKYLENDEMFKGRFKIFQNLEERDLLVSVLHEFTNTTTFCDTFIKHLRNSGQICAADELAKYNVSVGPMDLVWDRPDLKVKLTTKPIDNISNHYYLTQKIRGKCVIINNMVDQQGVNRDVNNPYYNVNGFQLESKRFDSVFKQLFFEVKHKNSLNSENIRKYFKDLSEDQTLNRDEAFIAMIITHGENEQVFGWDACEKMRQIKFGEIDENDQEAINVINQDKIGIKELVNIFAECRTNKLFFFTCCRCCDQDDNSVKNDGPIIRDNFKTINPNSTTTVCYSCTKGYETIGNAYYGITYFGQAFSHSLAQYACEENLVSIMSRTRNRLEEFYKIMKRHEKDYPLIQIRKNSFNIELTAHCFSKPFYFNPGYTRK